jgi:hypothetical protein
MKNGQVKGDEMGRVCSTNRAKEESIQDIGGKSRKTKTTRMTKT